MINIIPKKYKSRITSFINSIAKDNDSKDELIIFLGIINIMLIAMLLNFCLSYIL